MTLYNSIDEMPIKNWFKCIDLKDYSYCAIDKSNLDLNTCTEQFSKLYDEFIDTFGVNDRLIQIIELQNLIWSYKIDKALYKDETLQTFIDLKQIELNELLDNKNEKTKTYKVEIEKYLGFRLNENEVTVKEYYEYLEALKDNGRATS